MSKLYVCAIALVILTLLACSNSGQTTTQAPTTEAPTIMAAPTAAPTEAPTEIPSAVPAKITIMAPTKIAAAAPTEIPTTAPADVSTAEPETAIMSDTIKALKPSNPDMFLAALSETERSCLPADLSPQTLELIAVEPDLVPPETFAEFIGCLEDETLLRIFVGNFLPDGGELSPESTTCVRSGFGNLDLRSIMLGSVTQTDPEQAMMTGMVGFILTLGCLNDDEWEGAKVALDATDEERENFLCVLEELGGAESMAEALDFSAGPPIAFFAALSACGALTSEPPPQ